MRTQVSSVETSRVYMETDYKQKYDTIMKDKLQELRDEFEEEAENVKKDVENTYKQKVYIVVVVIFCRKMSITQLMDSLSVCRLVRKSAEAGENESPHS